MDTDIQLNQDLLQAARNHNLSEIKKLLRKGAELNYKGFTQAYPHQMGRHYSALYEAVNCDYEKDKQQEYIQVIKYLLQHGANPNWRASIEGRHGLDSYPLFHNYATRINKLGSQKQKIKFMELFYKYGMNMNQNQFYSNVQNNKTFKKRTCLIFNLMNSCGLKSRIEQLRKFYQDFDFDGLERQKDSKLRSIFNNQNKIVQNIEVEPETRMQQQENKPTEIDFLKSLINFGVDVNSSAQSYHQIDSDLESDSSNYSKKFTDQTGDQRQSLIHRAIMNNNSEFVRFLIQKGVDIEQKLQFPLYKPFYPNDWPLELKQAKINQNLIRLKKYQEGKEIFQKKIQKCQDENERKKFEQFLTQTKFCIFRAQRYSIEGDIPIKKCKQIKLSCLELAEILKVNPDIIQMLKNPKQIGRKRKIATHQKDKPQRKTKTKPILKKSKGNYPLRRSQRKQKMVITRSKK